MILDCSNTSEHSVLLEYQEFTTQSFLIYQFFDTTNDVYKHYLNLNKHVDKIEIKILGNFTAYSALLRFYSNYDSSSSQFLYPHNLNNIAFETSIFKRQKSSGCVDKYYGLFTDLSENQIYQDCRHKESNEILGCIPVFQGDFRIRLERDINHFNYTICPKEFKINMTRNQMEQFNKCRNIYQIPCETQLFNLYNNHRIGNKKYQYEINIIPKYNLITEYRYKNRMDFMDWVYNCGGIIGMWFGWSALSITNCLLLIRYYIKKIKFILKSYWTQHKIISETKNISFVTIDNKQVIVYH